jgi:Gluconate 2-dehydrogenase subunit 3
MPFRAPRRRGVTPGGEGRFPGFDVLAETENWDELTASVVLGRLDPPHDFSFFTPSEQATASALFDQLLAQDAPPKVPVLELVDRRLALDETDGWFYADMPEDKEAWRTTLALLDVDSGKAYGTSFAGLTDQKQRAVIQAVQDAEHWHDIQADHVWSLWTRYACAAFYSHPWSWNEIGFGGPAYPRGYRTLGLDALEPWEVRDQANSDPVSWANQIEEVATRHQDSLRNGSGGSA